MRELPGGTVTFLFTDIEGSTRLVQDLGERYSELLTEHQRVLRRAITGHGGTEVNTQGDALFAVFTRASDAVAAAAEAQRAFAQGPFRVRMGLHTGEPTVAADDYVGLDVHRVARIAAGGHGGQVLLSEETTHLLGNSVRLRDLGAHRLKDLTRPQRLYQLQIDGLPDKFPPLKTLGNQATNLPVQPNQLIGRKRELAELTGLLRDESVRLVTLTGPGGIGKTRLALQAAAELLDDFGRGVFFVSLAPIRDPGLVVASIAQAVELGQAPASGEVSGEELLDLLVAFLEEKEMLLLLDNFEQVVEAATTIGMLQSRAVHLKVLVTSRERLRLSAERIYEVPPLSVPEAGSTAVAEALAQAESVALFVARAQAVRPGFELTGENAPTIVEICRKLDGLPLAIELAAARSSVLPPVALLARLDERLPLLTGGARDADERQRTLARTIAWSYERLSEREQVIFTGLAVFVGGCRLEAAAAVFDPIVEPGWDLLNGLQSLVEKSLLRQREDADGEPRFRMLETIREYALERLRSGGGFEERKHRHSNYFLELAETAYEQWLELPTGFNDEWFALRARLSRDSDNLRAALEYFSSGHPELRLRLAAALGWFWFASPYFAEGRQQLDAALAVRPARDRDGARARVFAGRLAAMQGDVEAGKALVTEGLALLQTGDYDVDRANALDQLGLVHTLAGDYADAERCFMQSLELRQEIGRPAAITRSLLLICQVLVIRRDIEHAEPLAIELGDAASHFFADCALLRGDAEVANDRYCRAMERALRFGSTGQAATEMQGVAMAAVLSGHPVRALRLAAAAAAEQRRQGLARQQPWWMELLAQSIASAQQQLGSECAGKTWEEGQSMHFEHAVEYSLGGTPTIDVERPMAGNRL